jgi:O-antigen ligase
MNFSAFWLLVILPVAGIITLRGLFRPFFGLLILMTLHFVQPGEMLPVLAPLRLELVYGVLLLIVVLFNKATEIKALLKADPIIRATLLLLVIAVSTIPFAIWRGGAFESATNLVKMVTLQLLMVFFIDSQERLHKILWLMVGFLLWFAGSSFSAYLQGQFYVVGGVERAEGINSMVGGPNELAGLLLALLPFLVALIRCSRRFLVKLLLVVGGGLTLFVLLLTGARISFIALIAVAIFYILRSKRKLLSLSVTVVVGLAFWSFLPAAYQHRYLTLREYAEGGQLDASNQLRLAIWHAGWRMFLDHPLIGVGAGQFSTAYGTIYSGQIHKAWMNPHNLFLQVTCELGLVGLFAFIYFVVQLCKALREVLRLKSRPGFELNYEFAVACSFMFVGVALMSSVSHTLYRPYWFLLAGLATANRSIVRRILADSTAQEHEPTESEEPPWEADNLDKAPAFSGPYRS